MKSYRFAAALGLSSFLALSTVAPAVAGPYMSWGQWTSGGAPFGQCFDRAMPALRSVGLSATVQDRRFFHGEDDVFSVSVICFDSGNGYILTITVAAERSGVSPMTTDQVRDRIAGVIFGTATAGCASMSPVGNWNWWNGGTATFNANGTAHASAGSDGTWERRPDGSYHVHWYTWNSEDYFTISPDGMHMPGNYNGTQGTSTRACS